jgi:hypothetical protein
MKLEADEVVVVDHGGKWKNKEKIPNDMRNTERLLRIK